MIMRPQRYGLIGPKRGLYRWRSCKGRGTMRGKSLLAMIISIMLLLTGFFICTVDSDAKVVEDDSLHALGASNADPTTGWNVEEIDTPVGWSVFIWDVYGGWWSDAEKRPGDDAAGNPA
jgi:hypothetical protein